ncbi:MAG TPA: hypothetical protein VLA52_16190 [Thermohalobaculum sp.]|nr:hypothetical protein [Thermohalobaculum sp.]
MVRRVGFKEKDVPGSEPDAVGAPRVERDRLAIVFVLCWLGGWTIAILSNVADWFSRSGHGGDARAAFEDIWLVLAAFGWIAGAALLVWLLRGNRAPLAWRRLTTDNPLERSPVRSADRKKISRNWFGIIFVGIWLVGWTFGLLAAAVMLIVFTVAGQYGGSAFLVFWLIAAVVGWIVGWRSLKRLLDGESLMALNRW